MQGSCLSVIWQDSGSVGSTLVRVVMDQRPGLHSHENVFTRKRVHFNFPRFCGVRKWRCDLARNRVSRRCIHLLPSMAEQYFIRCWTPLRKEHLASYKGPLIDGLPSPHHASPSLLFAHSCDSVLSLNMLALLGFSSGSV